MRIQVILGSTRPGRVGDRVAKWVMATLSANPDVDVELIDLADFNLPHFNEDLPPRANQNRQPSSGVARYLARLAEGDGYIIVTPEYNFSIPGVLKDALDFVDFQLRRKPVAVVSYGVAGGTRASEHLKSVLNGVKAVVVPEAVTLTGPQGFLDGEGNFTGDPQVPFGPPARLQNTIQELVWWVNNLADRRPEHEKVAA